MINPYKSSTKQQRRPANCRKLGTSGVEILDDFTFELGELSQCGAPVVVVRRQESAGPWWDDLLSPLACQEVYFHPFDIMKRQRARER